ncbi:hypothetical protein BP5796_08329 [Coleophoma crateriformis]|uniref:C2H2-type domain-containing protein n=1 Tax=Coleophoma crateriformis TaxID=565419 RepID=A0A3D8R7A2_9HELO|nr:hypothetical protein BP5796_08329 [Coleophoma crateriformis]
MATRNEINLNRWGEGDPNDDGGDPENNEVAPLAPLPLDPDVAARIQAQSLDEYMARLQRQQFLNEKVENSKIIQKPGLDRNDPNYQEVRKQIRERLRTESIQSIMDDELDEVQRTLLVSPIMDPGGFLLNIQELRSQSYKTALRSPKWKGEMDNIATKLAMAKFGLPVQPITFSNQLALIDPTKDQDDPEDKTDTVPPIQRVVNSGTPLGFLDEYWERFYGYPGNRRARPTTLGLRGGAGCIEDIASYADGAYRNSLYDEAFLTRGFSTPALRLRGGDLQVNHTVYSYNGYAELPDCRVEGFIDASLRLLHYPSRDSANGNTSWAFKIYFSGVLPSLFKSRSVHVNQENYNKVWHDNEKAFESCLTGEASLHPDGGSQFLFVCHRGLPLPDSPTPIDDHHVIRLTRIDNSLALTVYWVLAKNLDGTHGLNQVQGDFYSAMKILASDHEFQGRVVINKCNLGFAGMEATQELWDAAKKSLKRRHPPQPWKVSVRPINQAAGLHLIGRSNIAVWRPQDYQGAFDAIKSLFQDLGAGRSGNIDKIRMFPTLDARLNGSGSAIIPLGDSAEGTKRIKNVWESQPVHLQGRCLYFRPEFSVLQVQEVGNDANRITWTVENTLQPDIEFMSKVVPKLFPGFDRQKDFITIPQIEPEEKFVISPDLSLKDRRVFVFDYLNREKICVSRGGDAYDREKLWGCDNSSPQFASSSTAAGTQPPTDPNPPAGTKSPTGPNPLAGTELPTCINPPALSGLRINQPRLLAARALKPQEMAFKPWRKLQDEKDAERLRAYTSYNSVAGPGRQGRIPITNNLRERSINVGSSMPQLFHQHRTPTEFKNLQDENISLRNQVLRRELCCPICTEKFPAYPQDDSQPGDGHLGEVDEVKRKHFQKHLKQCQAGGKCPLCDTDRFQFWSQDEKKQHLDNHYSVWYNQVANEERNGVYCRVCYIKFSTNLFPTVADITRHMETHVAGLKKFCDKCGLDMRNGRLEPWEQNQHLQKCINAPNKCTQGWPKEEQKYKRADNPEDMFCRQCGTDLEKANENEQTKKQHQNACDLKKKESKKWEYCGKCGVLLTLPQITEKQREAHAKKCIVPGGWSDRYCIQCGVETATLSDPQKNAEHIRSCRFKMPEFVDPSLRPQIPVETDHDCPVCKTRLPKDIKLLIAHMQTHARSPAKGDCHITQSCRDGLKSMRDELEKSALKYPNETPDIKRPATKMPSQKDVDDLLKRLDAAIRNAVNNGQQSKLDKPPGEGAKNEKAEREGGIIDLDDDDVDDDDVDDDDDDDDDIEEEETSHTEAGNQEGIPEGKRRSQRKRKRPRDKSYQQEQDSSEDFDLEPEPEDLDLKNLPPSSKKARLNLDTSFRPDHGDEDSDGNPVVSPIRTAKGKGRGGRKASSTSHVETVSLTKKASRLPGNRAASPEKKGKATVSRRSVSPREASTPTPQERSSRSRNATPSEPAESKKAASPSKRWRKSPAKKK